MPLLDKLERRFGRYAIRGLIGYIVFLQCIVFAVLFVNPSFQEKLMLRPFNEMDGEWWRLFSFLIVPDARSPIMFMFSAYVALMCMYVIEASFGTFRLNLFVAFFVLCQWGMAALSHTEAGLAIENALGAGVYPAGEGFFLNLFLVFAVLQPNQIFLLFGIVPLQAWVLALLDAGYYLFAVIRSPESWLVMVISVLPFLCFGVPIYLRHLRHRNRVGTRRVRFKANSLTTTDGGFHRCSVCGRTDGSDPDLDFRIAEDGTEYCSEHLPKS
jgi:hypothetical protein